jgi:hypothetical protein
MDAIEERFYESDVIGRTVFQFTLQEYIVVNMAVSEETFLIGLTTSAKFLQFVRWHPV